LFHWQLATANYQLPLPFSLPFWQIAAEDGCPKNLFLCMF